MGKFLWIAVLLSSCGVKQPPVAPRPRPVAVVNEPSPVDCSPTDENCDKRDPNYRATK